MNKTARLLTILGLTFSSISFAQSNSEWVRIPNASQCAADSQTPTESAFLYIDTTNIGRIAFQIGKLSKFDPDAFAIRATTAYKTRLSLLSEAVLNKVVSGQWPLIHGENSEIQALMKACNGRLNCPSLKAKFLEIAAKSPLLASPNNKNNVQCLQVQELSADQLQLFFQGVTKETLTAMAKSLSQHKSQKSCSEGAVKPTDDPSLLLQLDVVKNNPKFEDVGFETWNSFKTYLSLAWRNIQLPSDDPAFRQIFLNLSLEENLMLFSNGCKSISRPECTSDFLTSYQIRRMMISIKDTDPLNMNSEEMRDRLFQPANEDGLIQKNLIAKIDENQWAAQFFKSLSSISWGLTAEIKKSTQFFQTLSNKKTVDQMVADLNLLLTNKSDDKELLESFHYLCGEANLVGHPDFSFYKFDLENLEKFAKLEAVSASANINISQIIDFQKDLYTKLQPVCDRADILAQKQKYNFTKYSSYRPWFKRYLKKYSMFQALLDQETSGVIQGPVLKKPLSQNYLQLSSVLRDLPDLVFCTDAVDCSRTVFESIAHMNRIALSSRALLQNDIVSPGIFNRGADKVTCGLYNPWEAQDIAKKKLLMDLVSSVLFGWTRLPIYLDVTYKPGELVSFKKLVDDGKVKFDIKMDKPKAQASLALHFGALLGVPCSVQISQTEGASENSSDLPSYFFTGISLNACTGAQKAKIDLTSSISIGQAFERTAPTGNSICGSCNINFEQVLETSAKQFVPFRFFIRLFDVLRNYVNSKDDPSFPHADTVNLNSLKEAYEQYGQIPEHCVAPLKRGLQCRSNICESLIIRDIEMATHSRVESIELRETEAMNGSYDQAWISLKGCGKKVPVNFSCSNNGDSYYFNPSRLAQALTCGAVK